MSSIFDIVYTIVIIGLTVAIIAGLVYYVMRRSKKNKKSIH